MDVSPDCTPVKPPKLPRFDALVGRGVCGLVYALDNDTVLKASSGFDFADIDIAIEREAYKILGDHPRIVKCIGIEPRGMILERLLYPLRKRLRDIREQNEVPSEALVLRWARQAVEGLAYVHGCGILQADVGCHNLLLDKDDNVKLCDFAGSSIQGKAATVCYETRSQKPGEQNVTVSTEIFALGTMLYEISTASPPYPDIDSCTREIERLYAAEQFPDTESLLLGDIIKRSWNGDYGAVGDVQVDIGRIGHENARTYSDHHEWSKQAISLFLAAKLPSYVKISVGFLTLASISYIAIRSLHRR